MKFYQKIGVVLGASLYITFLGYMAGVVAAATVVHRLPRICESQP